MVLAMGLVLSAAGTALLLDLGGLGRLVITRVTGRKLGELAPGYAAGTGGFRVYATLLLALGIALLGIGLSTSRPIPGALLALAGVVAFGALSGVAIAGEVRTYRALPGRRPSPGSNSVTTESGSLGDDRDSAGQ